MPVHRRALWFICLAAAMVLAGCASKPPAPSAKKAARAPALETPEDTERRIAAYAHYATGLHYDLNNQPTAALEEYIQAAQANPGYEPLALEVARRLLREKQPERAIETLKPVAAHANSTGAVDAWLGLAYAQAGQTNAAIAANKAAIKKLPTHLAAYQNLSSLYLQTAQTNLALQTLANAARQKNGDAEFYIGLSGLYTRFGELNVISNNVALTNAIKLLDRAAKTETSDPVALVRLADGYMFHGVPEKAETVYARVLKDHPDLPGVREKLTDIYLKSGDRAKASAQLDALLRNNPTDAQLYVVAGTVAIQSTNYTRAEEMFDTALKLRPELEPLYYELAGLKLTLRKPEEALQLMERARRRFKVGFPIEFYTGVAHGMAERYTLALKHLTSAELMAKTSDPARLTAGFYFQLGSTAERAKDYEAAERYFRQALALKPDDAETLNYLGYMWAERGTNLNEAREFIEKAVKLEPENAAFLDSMAWVLFKLNKPAEALPWMEKAIAHSKTDPDGTLFDHLGDILAALGQTKKAKEAWMKALSIEKTPEIEAKLKEATGESKP
ncbi:MAG TPA: tetratricopeptide repeat protein [Methylomirabilota bacterium]|nr:tetratricopeptide repeat protein [Methylomirabilota bacterium]